MAVSQCSDTTTSGRHAAICPEPQMRCVNFPFTHLTAAFRPAQSIRPASSARVITTHYTSRVSFPLAEPWAPEGATSLVMQPNF